MSALAGIIHATPDRPVERSTRDRRAAVLSRYGRDAQNGWSRGGALLLRSLLRTTPEDCLDSQPLQSPASGRVLLFDGRLDNREALARQLDIAAADLRLLADSAVVIRALDAWGEQALDRLLGDFALASWEPGPRRLLLARDAVGYRPMFWVRGEGFFAFASLPKVLFAIPDVPRRLREDALHDYLCLLPLDKQATLFHGIFRLEPGQYLVVEGGREEVRRYHRFGESGLLKLADPREYVDGLAEQIGRAVAPRLRALGPLACELSSGLDSSTVAAVAARQLGKTGQRLLALTAVLPEGRRDGPAPPGFHRDEGPGARALAAMHANIDHVLVESTTPSPLQGLQERIESTDRPVFNPCNAHWVQALGQAAQERGARTLLNGWQGNLTISHDGLPWLQYLFSRGRLLAWRKLARSMRRRYPWVPRRWFFEFCLAPHVPASLWSAYQRRRGSGKDLADYSAASRVLQRRYDTPRRARQRGWDLLYRGHPNGVRLRVQPLYQVEFAETCLAMNASGLDPRSPTMDRRLVEYCLSIPEAVYLHEGCLQWPLRELGRGLLPEEILASRTRGYQAGDWFESATAARAELGSLLAQFRQHESIGDYLDLDGLQQLLDDWPADDWQRPEVETRYRNKLLRAMSVGAFVRYVENDNR
ncbi:MAG: hypothetical protein LAT56_02105 [Wenzhouxiangella sp.]|nr:hypothetical protein [Wenzhouxiangella sp.]